MRDAIDDKSFPSLPEPVKNRIWKKYEDLLLTGDV